MSALLTKTVDPWQREAELKATLRREYLQLNAMIDARGADCGMSLLGYISADCREQARKVIDILAALRRLDTKAPATPPWIETLAGAEGGKE